AETVTEDGETGWALTDLDCTGDDDFSEAGSTATLDVEPGETIVCTFTNTKDATLTVIKDAIPDDPQDFSFTNTGFAPATDLLDDDGDETNTLKSSVTYTFSGSDFDAGAETVTEDGETGWALTDLDCTGDDDFSEAGSTATLDVEPGETIVCTFENTKLGSITIVKDAVPNDAQDFEFDPTASLQANNFFLDDDANATLSNQKVFGSLLPGSYGVDEVNIPSLWDLTDISCTGDTGGVTEGTAGVSIDLAAGENVTCTFENTKRGTIIVEKQTVPDGSPGGFVFTGDAAGTLQDGGQITVGNLVPGPYTSTEADPTGIFFQLTSITCDDQASTTPSSGVIEPNGAGGTATFNLDPGETVKCVFTNTKAIHPGTIGFWRNWRNHYNSTEFQYLIDYLKANNPSVYASLTITKYDAIFDFPKGLGRDQMILAQLTAVKSNLAISDEGACFGLEQKNDDIFLNGSLVDLSPIPGATDYFDTNNDDKVTIEEVVDVIEGHWTGSLQPSYPKKWNDGFSSFSPLTDDQIITVLTGINEGWLIMDSGDGPSNCP
ncbi:MAG TPA: hypothetical protein VFT80_07210, partial [Actinomycetota bacterium]|nr:hypothetical protein [Actinomycetota bacterium]